MARKKRLQEALLAVQSLLGHHLPPGSISREAGCRDRC